jgi:hypothetical protein
VIVASGPRVSIKPATVGVPLLFFALQPLEVGTDDPVGDRVTFETPQAAVHCTLYTMEFSEPGQSCRNVLKKSRVRAGDFNQIAGMIIPAAN